MTATFLQDLTYDYEGDFHRWHGALIIFILILTVTLFNIFCSKVFPHLGVIILTLHMILFIIILVVITVMTTTKNSNEMVWNSFTWYSLSGRTKSNGLGFVMGLLTPAFAFIGVDGAIHLAEEVRNPSKVVPWAMIGRFAIRICFLEKELTMTSFCWNQWCHGFRDAHCDTLLPINIRKYHYQAHGGSFRPYSRDYRQ